jgi:S1-C subfamily serine protease
MSVTAKLSPDGTAQVHCPRPGCSAVLDVRPKSGRSWVTCAAAGCGHRFLVEVPGLAVAPDSPPMSGPPPLPPRRRPDDMPPRNRRRDEEEAGGSGMVIALVAGGAIALLLLGGAAVFGIVYALRDKDTGATSSGPVAQAPAPPFEPPMPKFEAFPPKGDPAVEPGPAFPVVKPFVPPAPLPKDPAPDEPAVPEEAAALPRKGPKKEPESKFVEDALEKVKRSTALIERKDKGSGSGFVIKSGTVMTNFHVISGALLDDLTVSFVTLDDTAPAPLKPTLLYCNPERDLAILRVDTDRPPLQFCPNDTKLEGLEVAVVGNPTDGVRGQVTVNKVTTGHLAAPIRRDAGWTYYELRAEARPGNSGGPVVDRKTGKLVGVMQSIALGKGPLRSYCIPYGEAKLALDRLPESKDKEPQAIKVAAARHYLDYFKREMPALESTARLGMQVQLHLLRAKAGLGGGEVVVRDNRTGKIMPGSEVMAQLKDEFDKVYPQLGKLLDGPIKAGPEVPSGLAQKARLRLETCGKMRSLASARTDTETAFRKEIDNRAAANDKAARAFDEDYKKFVDGLDAAPKGK